MTLCREESAGVTPLTTLVTLPNVPGRCEVGLIMVGFFLDSMTMVGFWDFWVQFVRIF